MMLGGNDRFAVLPARAGFALDPSEMLLREARFSVFSVAVVVYEKKPHSVRKAERAGIKARRCAKRRNFVFLSERAVQFVQIVFRRKGNIVKDAFAVVSPRIAVGAPIVRRRESIHGNGAVKLLQLFRDFGVRARFAVVCEIADRNDRIRAAFSYRFKCRIGDGGTFGKAFLIRAGAKLICFSRSTESGGI